MYRLLIVDSKKSVCDSLKKLPLWQRYGFTGIATAASYAEAASRAVDLPPHVALVDVKLGEQWGYDLVAHLRLLGLSTVFCMLSDFDDPRYMRKSMQAGAQDYLLKPVNQRELQAFLERAIVTELGGTLPGSRAPWEKTDPVLHVEYQKLSKITNKIILYTRNNYRSSLSLTAIAEVFKMSSKYIGRIFLRDTGMKFSEYLMAYRMMEARQRIINTQDKISVIANAVGYSQLNNFYIHFKKYFGVSPGALRLSDPPDGGTPAESNLPQGGPHGK